MPKSRPVKFRAWTAEPNDPILFNDTITGILADGRISTSFLEDFTGAVPNQDGNFSSLFDLHRGQSNQLPTSNNGSWTRGQHLPASITIKEETGGNGTWLYNNQAIEVLAPATFSVGYAMLDTNGMPVSKETDDTLALYLSTNCGERWNFVKNLTYDGNTLIEEDSIQLDTLVGSRVFVGVYYSKGSTQTREHELEIDFLKLEFQPPIDVALDSLLLPKDWLYDDPNQWKIRARIINAGQSNLDTIQLVTSLAGVLDTISLNTSIIPGDTLEVDLKDIDSLFVSDLTLPISIKVVQPLDPIASNDGPLDRTVRSWKSSLPNQDFASWTSAQLETDLPGWGEGTKLNGEPEVGVWRPATAQERVNFGSNAAVADISTNPDIVGLFTPPVKISMGQRLSFEMMAHLRNNRNAIPWTGEDSLFVLTFYPKTNNEDTLLALGNSGLPGNSKGLYSVGLHELQDSVARFYFIVRTNERQIQDDITLYVSNIRLEEKPTVDGALSSGKVIRPVDCQAQDSLEVKIRVANVGQDTLTNAVITIRDAQSLLGSKTLAAFASNQDSVFTFRLALGFGNSEITATLSTPGDTFTINDTLSIRFSFDPANTIVVEDFDDWPDSFDGSGFLNGWTSSPSPSVIDFNWRITGSPTPTASTGPTNDFSGNGKYAFTESSLGNSGTVAELVSPCIPLNGSLGLEVSFAYHMFGTNMGELILEAEDSLGKFTEIGRIEGQQQSSASDPWEIATFRARGLKDFTRLKFKAQRGSGNRSDMAIDQISYQFLPDEDVKLLSAGENFRAFCDADSLYLNLLVENQGGKKIASPTLRINSLEGNDVISSPDTITFELPSQIGLTLGEGTSQGILQQYTFSYDLANKVAQQTYITGLSRAWKTLDFDAYDGSDSSLNKTYLGWHEARDVGLRLRIGEQALKREVVQRNAVLALPVNGNVTYVIAPKLATLSNDTLSFQLGAASNAGSNVSSLPLGTTVKVWTIDDCGVKQQSLFNSSTLNNNGYPKRIEIPLLSSDTVRLAIEMSALAVAPSFLWIDDVELKTSVNHDLALLGLYLEDGQWGGSTGEQLRAYVANRGKQRSDSALLETSIDGTTYFAQVPSLDPGEVVDVESANFLAPSGTYQICADIQYSPDQISTNDTFCTSAIVSVPINDLTQFTSISLYPNPTSSSITIESHNNLDIMGIKVFNYLGNPQEVVSRELRKGSFLLELGHLPKGVYLVQVVHRNGIEAATIMKE